MDPASNPLFVHGHTNLYHGIVISGTADDGSTPASSTQSAGRFCLWEQKLCYSEVEEGSEVQYHPGYLIFYPTAVVIIPFPRTFSFQKTKESQGTGVFHPLASIRSGDGSFRCQPEYSHPSLSGAQKITGALYLTEAATYVIGQHFVLLPSRSCKNPSMRGSETASMGGSESESAEHNRPSRKFESIAGVGAREKCEQSWRSNFPEPTEAEEDQSGLPSSDSSFAKTSYNASLCKDLLPSSTPGIQMSSESWNLARGVPWKNDQQGQPSQYYLPCDSPLGSKSIIESLGDRRVTSSLRTEDSKWPSEQDTAMLNVDGSDRITSSVLSAKKGSSQVVKKIKLLSANKRKSQIVKEIEALCTTEGKSIVVDEEIEGKHTRASVELEDQEHRGKEVCHLPCQMYTHPCASLPHPGYCPPCKALVKQDCHCKALVHSFNCYQFTSASKSERERMLSCGGFCHKRLPDCAHMCSNICHERPCQPRSCHKKVILRCQCQRLRKEWLCCDVQEAKLWGKSSLKQKRYQLGQYSGLIPCDKQCSLSVMMKEIRREPEVQRDGEGKKLGAVGLAVPRQWSFTTKVIVLFAISLMFGVLLGIVIKVDSRH